MAQEDIHVAQSASVGAASAALGVARIARFGVVVRDLQAALQFYVQALGFEAVGVDIREGEAFAALTGLADARAQVASIKLGEQCLELLQFDPSGAPYPAPRFANDPWFQHFAIAVADMPAAFSRLSRFPSQPISEGGPQRLPPSTGEVVAYKFRDPDGHPLELFHAPASHWAKAPVEAGAAPNLGLDHSALAVADLDASLRFYIEGLGLSPGSPALNQGREQARLDGLEKPVVDIATLTTRESGPHLELLHYRSPRSTRPPSRLNVNDIAATRLTLQTDTLELTLDHAIAVGGTPASSAMATLPSGRAVMLKDPDGHLLELVEA